MKILITGGLGYIGGRLAKFLIDRGYSVILLTRKKVNTHILLPYIEIKQISWDSFEKNLEIFDNIDCLIHAAGMNASDCESNPAKAMQFNSVMTEKLLNISVKTGIKKFIYISTAHVYSESLEGEISEESPTLNNHPYAVSKKLAEDHVIHYSFRNLIDGIVIRLSNAFGPPIDMNANCWTLVLNDVAKQIIQSSHVVLNSSGRQRRDFIPMLDVCRAIKLLLEDKNLKHRIFNVGGEWCPRIKDAANFLIERNKLQNNNDTIIKYADLPIEDSAKIQYNINRIKSIGFELSREEARINEIDNLLRFIKN